MVSIIYGDSFEQKYADLVKGGADNLHIVTDFDRTLTKSGEGAKTSFHALYESPLVSQKYKQEYRVLFNKYAKIETNMALSEKKRSKEMDDWWRAHQLLLVQENLVKKDFENFFNKNHIHILRDGVESFFKHAENCDVPTLIFSAGIGDVIQQILDAKNITGTISVVSNFLVWDIDGVAIGYRPPLITPLKKKGAYVSEFHKKIVAERKGVLLIGDSLSDVSMADSLLSETILRIGFVDDAKNMEAYCEVYDVVISGDADFSEVNRLFLGICA